MKCAECDRLWDLYMEKRLNCISQRKEGKERSGDFDAAIKERDAIRAEFLRHMETHSPGVRSIGSVAR
jgi:hypothetical protein